MPFTFLWLLLFPTPPAQPPKNRLTSLTSPILFRGNERTAYRDPAVLYHRNTLYLFFTLVRVEDDGKVYSYTAMSTSNDLRRWSPVRILTPRDQRLDFSSPGNVVRQGEEWVPPTRCPTSAPATPACSPCAAAI